MKKGFFITGTDTGVGKTYVAVGLIRAFRALGYTVCPMKPVETGCKPVNRRPVPADTRQLIRASGVNEPDDTINPYRFRHPLAPSVAAGIENVIIKKQKILAAYRSLSKRYDMMIVEGAGGIMVPVCKKYLFLDLVRDLRLPIVIVSRPGLGTINHTLLTVETARNRGLALAGVIINYSNPARKGFAERTNPHVIEALGGVRVLGIVPHTINHLAPAVQKIFFSVAERLL